MKYNVSITDENKAFVLLESSVMPLTGVYDLIQNFTGLRQIVLMDQFEHLEKKGSVSIRGATRGMPMYLFHISKIEEKKPPTDILRVMASNEEVLTIVEEQGYYLTLVDMNEEETIFDHADVTGLAVTAALRKYYDMDDGNIVRFFSSMERGLPAAIRSYSYNDAPYSLHVQKKG